MDKCSCRVRLKAPINIFIDNRAQTNSSVRVHVDPTGTFSFAVRQRAEI